MPKDYGQNNEEREPASPLPLVLLIREVGGNIFLHTPYGSWIYMKVLRSIRRWAFLHEVEGVATPTPIRVYMLLIVALLISDAATCLFLMNSLISSSLSYWLPFICSLSSILVDVIFVLVLCLPIALKSFSPFFGWSSRYAWCTYKYISKRLSYPAWHL
jgi:hypothetical protein